MEIAWFGGEPLLAKEIIVEIMSRVREICLKNKKPFYSNITTNGYELDIKTFERKCLSPPNSSFKKSINSKNVFTFFSDKLILMPIL